jgi:hypothetical protein
MLILLVILLLILSWLALAAQKAKMWQYPTFDYAGSVAQGLLIYTVTLVYSLMVRIKHALAAVLCQCISM